MNKEVIEIVTNSILYKHLKERTLIEFNHWGIDIDEKELTPKINLKDLGLDSLDITMIIFETEIDFEIDIPEGKNFPKKLKKIILQENIIFLDAKKEIFIFLGI